MTKLAKRWLCSVVAIALAGCVSVALVPGADKVKITNNPNDVANCKAVGNVDVGARSSIEGDLSNQLRNHAIGLSGNVIFRTAVTTGVAYQCS